MFMNNIQDKIIWKLTSDGFFFLLKLLFGQIMIKFPHPTAKLLIHIWKLNLIPKVKLFAWELIRGKITIRGYLRNVGIDVDGDCPFCHNHLEEIDHFFRGCSFGQRICNTIAEYCLSLLEVTFVSFTGSITFGNMIKSITKSLGKLWKKSLLLLSLFGLIGVIVYSESWMLSRLYY